MSIKQTAKTAAKGAAKRAVTNKVSSIGKNRKKGQRIGPGKIIVLILLLVVVAAAAWFFLPQFLGEPEVVQVDGPPVVIAAEGEVVVTFIDVGQADAFLIQAGEQIMLIDAARRPGDIVPVLHEMGITKIDIAVGTHPHADHIGGMAGVINEFDVGQILLPDAVHTTQSFLRMMDAIEERNVPMDIPYQGQRFQLGNAHFYVVAPEDADETITRGGDFNDASIVVRLVHGNTAFLFTGDAEHPAERQMLASGQNLGATVMLAGHHGSRTSSLPEFVDAVNPEIAVISVGAHNKYGHPHQVTLDTFAERNIPVYRTDELGTLVFVSDGNTVTRRY